MKGGGRGGLEGGLKFGVFDHLDASGAPLAEFYETRLRLAEAYDRIGIHALHVAEHHATPLGLSPSPSVFLACVAQRTRRLRFGPLVYTLALYHPLRLADEICMLDNLSGGRFELGVGRGVSPIEIEHFGVDPAKSQAMYVEAYQVILKAMRERILSFEGEFYRFKDVPLQLAPLQRPHPPIWYGLSNPESAEFAAEYRFNVVSNAAPGAVRVITDRYRAAWQRRGNDPARIPFMGTARHVVIAGTDAEATTIARRAYARWWEGFIFLWRLRGLKPPFTTYTEDFDAVLASGQAIAGSPDTVHEAIAAQVKAAGINYFLLRFAFGDLTLAESLRSVELFARHVRPALAQD
ncbi:MAG TPA: LLM class flavin-dependent oxidoreductase [Burkholderiales bacterium]|nr:LLM class flavin-dependent oxidoreductase [Burkholderiales bacterium]